MYKLIALISFFLIGSVNAQSFAKKNNFKIGVHSSKKNNMTEKIFDQIIAHVEKIYKPIVKIKGGNLKIVKRWTDPTVNAYAQRDGKTYLVTMFGGLARHPELTADGFALVVCHEIAHHIGGSPRKGQRWASSEGQSDYWATSKCAKRIFGKFNNRKKIAERKAKAIRAKRANKSSNLIIDKIAEKKCNSIYSNSEDKALCLRSSMAGLSLARTLATLGRSPMPKFNTPDPGKVQSTNHRHPAAQCRLDTYFQGSLCTIDMNEEISSSDPFIGTCNRVDGDKVGIRPRCWFNPADYK